MTLRVPQNSASHWVIAQLSVSQEVLNSMEIDNFKATEYITSKSYELQKQK
jgi:hypothetical protein